MSARRSRRRRQADPELPACLARILAAHVSGAILSRPGILADITVMHREDCPMPRGQGPCICAEADLDLELVYR